LLVAGKTTTLEIPGMRSAFLLQTAREAAVQWVR
jgi:hypothetical protein